jgi:hypothetical protein
MTIGSHFHLTSPAVKFGQNGSHQKNSTDLYTPPNVPLGGAGGSVSSPHPRSYDEQRNEQTKKRTNKETKKQRNEQDTRSISLNIIPRWEPPILYHTALYSEHDPRSYHTAVYYLFTLPYRTRSATLYSQNEGLSSDPDLVIPGTDVAVQAQDP